VMLDGGTNISRDEAIAMAEQAHAWAMESKDHAERRDLVSVERAWRLLALNYDSFDALKARPEVERAARAPAFAMATAATGLLIWRTDMKRKAKPRRPMATGKLGAVFHTSVGNFPDGFYWFATEDVQMFRRVIQNDPDAMAAQEWHGPFKTRAEDAKAAEVGVLGEQCEIKPAGAWDPNWERPQ